MTLSKSKIFLFCCLAFIGGIAAASFFGFLAVETAVFWWFGGFVLCVAAAVMRWRHSRARAGFLVAAFFCLGIWRYGPSLPSDTPDKIWHYNGETVTVTGIVTNEPDIRQTNQKLEIVTRHINREARNNAAETQNFASPRDVSGKILVTTNLYPAYRYGDELEMTCDLETPEEFDGFAYDRYLARFDIYSVCYYPKIRKVDERKGNRPYAAIFRAKEAMRGKINKGLSEPSASLAAAVMLGDKKGLPEELRAVFSRAGISHIVAISGMHISILAALVMGGFLGTGMPRRHAFYLSVLFLAVYITLIGLPASAMRAGLMGFLVLWALQSGRLSKLTNSLALAAAILLFVNPRLLRDDIGFQLSFLAVAGIAYFYPAAEGWIGRRMERSAPKLWRAKTAKAAASVLALTAAAQIFTTPVIALNFSSVSLVAPLTNLLVLWCLPPLMVALMAALALSSLWSGAAVAFFAPAKFLLGYIMTAAGWAAALPLSSAETGGLWPGWLLLWYVFWVWAAIRIKKRENRKKSF